MMGAGRKYSGHREARGVTCAVFEDDSRTVRSIPVAVYLTCEPTAADRDSNPASPPAVAGPAPHVSPSRFRAGCRAGKVPFRSPPAYQQ